MGTRNPPNDGTTTPSRTRGSTLDKSGPPSCRAIAWMPEPPSPSALLSRATTSKIKFGFSKKTKNGNDFIEMISHHHTTSHHTTSHHIPSHHITSHHHIITSHLITAQHNTAQHSRSYTITPQHNKAQHMGVRSMFRFCSHYDSEYYDFDIFVPHTCTVSDILFTLTYEVLSFV